MLNKVLKLSTVFCLSAFLSFSLFSLNARADSLADLTVSDIKFTADNCQSGVNAEPGQQGTLSVTIKNLGGALTDSTGLLNWYNNLSSQNFVFMSPTSGILNFQTNRALPTVANPLGTNESISFTWVGKFNTSGNLYTQFTVDNANELVESNENNNTFSQVIVIGDCDGATTAKVDLGIISLGILEKSISDDGANQIKVIVKNFGTESVNPNTGLTLIYGTNYSEIEACGVNNCFGKGNVYNAKININAFGKNSLAPGEQYTMVFNKPNYLLDTIEFTDDTEYLFKAIIDTDNSFGDSNLVNNVNSVKGTPTYFPQRKNFSVGSSASSNNGSEIVLKLERRISEMEKLVIELEQKITQINQAFSEKYAGTMFLDVENYGRLWYVDPVSLNRFYFENGEAALSIGAKLATGITYENLQKIPVGIPENLYNLTDTDGDGLPDRLEIALGTDPNKADTDGDGYNDKAELSNNYNPVNNQKYNYDHNLVNRLEGKMMLQVSGPNSHGEIWYIHNGKRWYGGTQDSMYEIMKALSLGAISSDIRKIEVGGLEQ